MLKNWLTTSPRNPSQYKFPVIDISELKESDDEVAIALGNLILQSHGNPQMIETELLLLLEDITNLNLDVIKEYLEKEILPKRERVIVRVGNFGEILAANLLIKFEDFEFPIYKLRLREKKDWAAKLTDICLIKKNEGEIPCVFYGEVKTRSDKLDVNTGIEGHNSLATDDALENPEILNFICKWLYETQKFEEATFYSKLRLGKTMYTKRHELFIVHNLETWNDEVLQRLHDFEIDVRLENFAVRVIYVSSLRDLIDLSYEKCVNAAEDLIYGKERVS